MQGYRILIVEDDPKMRDALQYIMRKEGYGVDAVGEGERALEKLKATDYELIISDLKLPGMDGMDVLRAPGAILTVTENGYGKRTDSEEYRLQTRGGMGLINIQTSDRNGSVVGIAHVTDDDELMLMTEQGKILRTSVSQIREIGRNSQGVRLIQLQEGDRVVSIARFAERGEPGEVTEVADIPDAPDAPESE